MKKSWRKLSCSSGDKAQIQTLGTLLLLWASSLIMSGEIMLSSWHLSCYSQCGDGIEKFFPLTGEHFFIPYECSFFDKEVKLIVLKQC